LIVRLAAHVILASLLLACSGGETAGDPPADSGTPSDSFVPKTYRDPLVRASTIDPDTGLEILEVRARSDGRVYFCTNVRGLQIADGRDAGALRTLAQFRSSVEKAAGDEKPGCQHVAWDGDVAFATNRGSELHKTPFLVAYEVSTKKELAIVTATDKSFEGVAVDGDHVWVALHENGIAAYAKTGLAEVSKLSGFANAAGVAAASGRLYVADLTGELVVVDVRDARAPRVTGRVSVSGSAQSIALEGSHAFVALGAGGFAIVDVADPAAPRVLSTVNTPGSATQVAVSKGFAFVSDWTDVRAFDVRDPAKPRLLGTERPPSAKTFSRVLGIGAMNDTVFVGEWSALHAYRFDATASAPDLLLPLPAVEIGTVAAGASQTFSLPIENAGTEPLVIHRLTSSNASFTFSAPSLNVPAASTGALTVTYTAATTDEVSATLTLESDDPDEPTRTIPANANRPGIGVGDPAPAVEVDVLGGSRFRLSEQRGNVVLLAYFATF
jgi:hypothetical protein